MFVRVHFSRSSGSGSGTCHLSVSRSFWRVFLNEALLGLTRTRKPLKTSDIFTLSLHILKRTKLPRPLCWPHKNRLLTTSKWLASKNFSRSSECLLRTQCPGRFFDNRKGKDNEAATMKQKGNWSVAASPSPSSNYYLCKSVKSLSPICCQSEPITGRTTLNEWDWERKLCVLCVGTKRHFCHVAVCYDVRMTPPFSPPSLRSVQSETTHHPSIDVLGKSQEGLRLRQYCK